ncbi:MAG: outer membrane protein assembly factor BamA [Kiritimatiellaeota bacterium]|nr:outer membrane protein assembly factor BamA [Kiritimatiellota bacterium]
MYKLWRVCFVLVFVMSAVVSNAQTVKSVIVRTLDTFGTDAAADVLQYCSVKAGEAFSPEAASRDVKALLDTGRFAYVGVLNDTANGEFTVIYEIERRHLFQEPLAIVYTNSATETVGRGSLKESKLRKVSDLKSGEPIDERILATRAAKIRDEYRKYYFRNVQVGWRLEPIKGSAGFAHVTFVVEEGERQKIKDFTFTNNTSISAPELRSAFGEYPWWNPRGWFTDTPISSMDLEVARQKVEDAYRDRGFLDARVDFPEIERVGEGKINVVFNVTEGDSYTVESVAVRGVTLFPDGDVQGSARLETDMLCGQKAIDDAAKGIRDYYGSRGYSDTAVRPFVETVPGQPGRAVITFDVREGQLTYIRKVVIRGNNTTKDKVMRREILTLPSDTVPIDQLAIERSENRLKNMGYFAEVRSYTENEENRPEGGVYRDLVYDVKEKRTGNALIGAGFSSLDQGVLFAEISESNFDILNWPNLKGGGQKARAGIEIGMRNQAGEISWREPWFLDRPIWLDVDLYYRQLWYREYDVTRLGASVGLSYPMKIGNLKAGRLGMSYTLEQVDMKSVDNGNWYTKDGLSLVSGGDGLGGGWGDWTGGVGDESRYFKWQKEEYGGNVNSVGRLYWERDERDRVLIPTRGYRAFVFGDLAEGGIGDNQFYRMGANYRHWFPMPWGQHVLSLRGRLETVEAYEGELPIYEKLFLGGPRTVRGVKYRDIGPKAFSAPGVSDHHVPLGGQTLALGTAEYTVPLFKAVRLAAFMDAGALGEDAFGGSMSSFCVSAGIGLRIDLPNFPIRFDIARPFKRDDSYTEREFFSFTIGFD